MRSIKERNAGKRPLVGVEKAALLLLAIGKPRSVEILKALSQDEVEEIARSAEALRTPSPEELDSIIADFETSFFKGAKFVGNAREIKELLVEALGEESVERPASGPALSAAEPIWPLLAKLPVDVLRAYIARLHPQAAAVILSKLDSARVAEVLGPLDKAIRNELFERLLAMRTIELPAMRALEDALRADLAETAKQSSAPHASIAQILNRLDGQDVADALAHIDLSRPKDARSIRKLLFKFEDLLTLSIKDLTVLVDKLPVETVVLALQGMEATFQAGVLAVMAPRAKRLAESELQSGATVNANDVATARRSIADNVLKMAADGVIALASAADDAEAQQRA